MFHIFYASNLVFVNSNQLSHFFFIQEWILSLPDLMNYWNNVVIFIKPWTGPPVKVWNVFHILLDLLPWAILNLTEGPSSTIFFLLGSAGILKDDPPTLGWQLDKHIHTCCNSDWHRRTWIYKNYSLILYHT